MATATTLRATERRLLDALEQAERRVNAGASPSDAVADVACDHLLKVGEATILLRAFNTGRTHSQLDQGGDAARADTPLADPDVVMARLRHHALTKAADIVEPSEHYAANPLAQKPRGDRPAPPAPTKDAPCELPQHVTPTRELHRITAPYQQLVDKCAKFDGVFEEAVRAVDDELVKLARVFRRGADWCAVRHAATQLGDAGAGYILDEIAARDKTLAKRAARPRVMLSADENAALHTATQLHAACTRLLDAHQKRADLQRQLEAASQAVVDYVNPPQALHPADPRRLDPTFEPARKRANGLGTLLPVLTGYNAATSYHNATPPMQQQAIRAVYNQLDDPAHENRLRAIRARADLTDMLASDPVLQGYSGADVADGYNALATTAPRAAESPMYMRAMLRRYLAQGGVLDPDDIRGNVLEADKTLAQTRDAGGKTMLTPDAHAFNGQIPKAPGVSDAARGIGSTLQQQEEAASQLFGP